MPRPAEKTDPRADNGELPMLPAVAESGASVVDEPTVAEEEASKADVSPPSPTSDWASIEEATKQATD